jgi:putative intracellular protease/amidase/YHS domain-containing protein
MQQREERMKSGIMKRGIMTRGFSIGFVYTLFLAVSLTAVSLTTVSLTTVSLTASAQESSRAVVPLLGLDPVALIEGREVKGKEEFSFIRGNFKYLFASKSNRAKFEAAPERYEIQRNGECMAMRGVKTKAEIFKVYDGKIYAFGTLLCRERFTLSPESFINPKPRTDFKPRNVAILIFNGVELLDFAGPGEVFAAAQTIEGQRAFNVYTVAPSADDIISQGFVKVTPQHTIENCPRPDIIVVPGGGVNNVMNDEKVMAWIKNATRESEITMSVCTGANLLARARLLDDKKATTHWASISRLKADAPTATVLENARFVDNGQVITTAGVSAGIDGALHVVDRMLGRPAAQLTARYMEYDWKPMKKLESSIPGRKTR